MDIIKNISIIIDLYAFNTYNNWYKHRVGVIKHETERLNKKVRE